MRPQLTTQIWYYDQAHLRTWIVAQLAAAKIDFQLIDGNIVKLDKPNAPCFVAHMDTVNDKALYRPLVFSGGRMFREDAILGADDRAGVQIIWDDWQNINFILTRDEERGLQGAATLAELTHLEAQLKDLEITALIEFDRKGDSDIIGEFNDYCTTDLVDAVADIAPSYKSAMGVCTDLDELNRLGVEGVNLSVGYYNQHTKQEYLVLSQFERARRIAKDLAKGLSGIEPFRFNMMKAKTHGPWWDDFQTCPNCWIDIEKGTACEGCGWTDDEPQEVEDSWRLR